jgi:nicotinate (nicotinamide) nucleotide adenylyltransferase
VKQAHVAGLYPGGLELDLIAAAAAQGQHSSGAAEFGVFGCKQGDAHRHGLYQQRAPDAASPSARALRIIRIMSRIEIDRPGPSYTVDTVRAFREALGPRSPLYFITGFDAVREILTWREPDVFLQLCRLVAVTRPGYPMAEVEALRAGLRRQAEVEDPLHILEVPALAISSSDIRRRVAAGEPIKYLVPESVETYVEKTGLYRPGGGGEVQGVVGD